MNVQYTEDQKSRVELEDEIAFIFLFAEGVPDVAVPGDVALDRKTLRRVEIVNAELFSIGRDGTFLIEAGHVAAKDREEGDE